MEDTSFCTKNLDQQTYESVSFQTSLLTYIASAPPENIYTPSTEGTGISWGGGGGGGVGSVRPKNLKHV